MTKPNTATETSGGNIDMEARLRLLAGKIGGIEHVLHMLYEGDAKECDFVDTLRLVESVAGDVHIEIHAIADEMR